MKAKHGIALYIEPTSHRFLCDQLFELTKGSSPSSLDRCFVYLREVLASKGVPVHTADFIPKHPEGWRKIYVATGLSKEYRKLSERPDTILSAFFATESPIVDPSLFRELNRAQNYFKRVYSCSDSRSLERFVGGSLNCKTFRWPVDFKGVHETIWGQENRKFLTMINMNKLPRVYWKELFTERMRAVEFFSRTGEIDLYGVGWEKPSMRMGKTWVPYTFRRIHYSLLESWQRFWPDPLLKAARSVYLGQLESKPETLGQYNFVLCFENTLLKGWITEKIFDCFYVGTIPVYWGATDVEELIPPECFIDMRDFANYEELRSYLKSLSLKEIRKYKENARDFLGSPQYQPFTKQAFVEIFTNIIEEDTGIEIT